MAIILLFWSTNMAARNSQTDDIRSIQSLDVFKNKIKTLLFREASIS